MAFARPKQAIDKPTGEVSSLPPPVAETKVCVRQGRSTRRAYSPTDLKRIYRYVVGSHGYASATCAILEESGIQDFMEENLERFRGIGLCDVSVDASEFVGSLPSGWLAEADQLLDVEPGTVRDAFDGCSDEVDSIQSLFRAALGGLILLWGLWRRVKLSRIYRFVLRRFLVFTAAFILLDKLDSILERLIPALAIVSVITREIAEVCDDAAEETNS